MRKSQYLGGHGGMAAAVTVTVMAAGTLSGCGPTPTAKGVTGTTQATTTATTPAATATSLAPEPSSGTPIPADRTLGDDGIGGLFLGMSRKAAMATGLVGREVNRDNICEMHKGKGDLQYVYFINGKVGIIAVGPAIRMAKGIGVGDTYRELHAKYPQAVEGGPGRISVDAPGAKVPAHYRVGMHASDPSNTSDTIYPDSTITEIALQRNSPSCYE